MINRYTQETMTALPLWIYQSESKQGVMDSCPLSILFFQVRKYFPHLKCPISVSPISRQAFLMQSKRNDKISHPNFLDLKSWKTAVKKYKCPPHGFIIIFMNNYATLRSIHLCHPIILCFLLWTLKYLFFHQQVKYSQLQNLHFTINPFLPRYF